MVAMRVDAPAFDDQDFAVVVAFCRTATSAPAFDDEREDFDELADRFVRAHRRRLFRSRRFDPPTGAGFDFPTLLEQLLPLVAILWQATVDRVAENTVDGLGRATASRVRRLMRRTEPEPEPERLTPEEEERLFRFTVERAVALGIEKQRAELLAEAVIGAFRLDDDER
jgi:hypothetical protein